MAKIFVSMYNFARHSADYTIMPPFYETFTNGLAEAGNEVLVYFHKDFYKDFSGEMPEYIAEKVKKFNADLYIFFNNNFWDITSWTDKPILIYDVDSPLFYKNLDKVKADPNRFRYMTIQKNSVELLKEIVGVEGDIAQFAPPFTGILSDSSIEPETNISFIGSNWTWEGCRFVQQFLDNPDLANEDRLLAKKVYEEYARNPFKSSEEIYQDFGFEPEKKIVFQNDMNTASRISGIKRISYLETISDLGLEIHGLYFSQPNTAFFPGVAFSFNKDTVFTRQENQDVFNRSKLSFNINHIQAITGFSWRVCDIMASNAAIVTEYKPDLAEAFPGVRIPTFTTKAEAYEICKRLLENENERKEIVLESNEIIEKKYRFNHTLKAMEDFLGLTLHTEGEGTLDYIYEPRIMKNDIDPIQAEMAKDKKKNHIFMGYRAVRKCHHLMGKFLDKHNVPHE